MLAGPVSWGYKPNVFVSSLQMSDRISSRSGKQGSPEDSLRYMSINRVQCVSWDLGHESR